MGFKTYDYECRLHGIFTELIHSEEDPDAIDCPECDERAERLLAAPVVLNNSLPDGTRRFAHIKERTKLQRAAHAAKHSGRFDDEKKIRTEMRKLK